MCVCVCVCVCVFVCVCIHIYHINQYYLAMQQILPFIITPSIYLSKHKDLINISTPPKILWYYTVAKYPVVHK